jgi:hypothetical protein
MKTKTIQLLIVLTTLFSLSAFADAEGKAKFQAAVTACAQDAKVTAPTTRAEWKALDPGVREDIHACLVKDGFNPKHHRHHKFIKAVMACAAQQPNVGTFPAFQKGVKPTFTPAQQAAIATCKTQVKAQFQAKHAAGNPSSSAD